MIEVGRNNIVIRDVDFNTKEYDDFYKAFSVYDKVCFRYVNNVFTIVNNDVYIPSSITADVILKYFPNKKVVKNYLTTSIYSGVSYNMVNQIRDDLQREGLKFLKRMKYDPENKQRFLSLATGKGKTFTSILLTKELNVRPLIIVDKISLAEQWRNQFLLHTDINENKIKIISGAKTIKDENSDCEVFIAVNRTLDSMIAKDKNSMSQLCKDLKIGIKIFDEAHHNMKSTCQINSLSNVEYILYLTATPSRSQFSEDIIYSRIFKKIPYFNGKFVDNVVERYLNVILYRFDSEPPAIVKANISTNRGFSINNWCRWLYDKGKEKFDECLLEIMDEFKLFDRKMQTVIILPEIELIENTKIILDEYLKKYEIECSKLTGSMKEKDRIEAVKNQFILTTSKMFEKALDKEEIECIINFDQFRSAVKLEQTMGRIRYGKDKRHIYIDVTDRGFPQCKSMLTDRKRLYKAKVKSIVDYKKKN